MSALAIAIGSDGIVAVCDGVCYEYETGLVSGFVSKVILLPEYNSLIGWTGAGEFGVAFRWAINQRIASFDDLVAGFEELCMDVHIQLFGEGTGPLTEVSCVIAGWSDKRQAFEGYRLVSYEKPSVDLSDGRTIKMDPFKIYPIPGWIWCSHSPKKLDEFGLNPPSDDDSEFNIAVRLICASRAESGWKEPNDDEEVGRFFVVGGFVQATVLRKDSIESRIVHRWLEDVIGKPVNPALGDPLPKWLESSDAAPA